MSANWRQLTGIVLTLADLRRAYAHLLILSRADFLALRAVGDERCSFTAADMRRVDALLRNSSSADYAYLGAAMPYNDYTWSQELFDALPERVRKTRLLLEEWFRAIEDGTAERRLPDPFFTPAITDEQADNIVTALDAGFAHELGWAASLQVAGGPYEAAPGFERLAPAQRMALAQQLYEVLKRGVVAPVCVKCGAVRPLDPRVVEGHPCESCLDRTLEAYNVW